MVKLNVEQLNPKEGFEPCTAKGLRKHPADSVDEIQCEDYAHIADDFIGLMDDIHRVLKKGGKANVYVPYFTSARAHMDFRTKRLMNEGSFLILNREWREANAKNLGRTISSDFDISFSYVFDPEFEHRSEEARQFAMKFYNNVVMAFQAVLTKK